MSLSKLAKSLFVGLLIFTQSLQSSLSNEFKVCKIGLMDMKMNILTFNDVEYEINNNNVNHDIAH